MVINRSVEIRINRLTDSFVGSLLQHVSSMLLKPDAVERRCKEDVQADAKEDGAYGSDSDGADEHSSPGNSSPNRGRPGP